MTSRVWVVDAASTRVGTNEDSPMQTGRAAWLLTCSGQLTGSGRGSPDDSAGRRRGLAWWLDEWERAGYLGKDCMRAQVQVGPEAELMWRRDSDDDHHTGGSRHSINLTLGELMVRVWASIAGRLGPVYA